MATLNFNANNVEPTTGFDAIPEGKYLALISDSKMKPTKNGNGSYLELTFQVIEGQYRSRQIWARLNLDNPNPKAVQIAQAELSAICRAVGVMTPQDSSELHNIPLTITVKCEKQEGRDITNVIKKFEKREAVMAGAGLGNNGSTAPASTSPPWARK